MLLRPILHAQIRIRSKPVSDSNLGKAFGQNSHTNTVEELAIHRHPISVSAPSVFTAEAITTGEYIRAAAIKSNAWQDQVVNYNYDGATGVRDAGSATSFSITQPSLALNQIIKM